MTDDTTAPLLHASTPIPSLPSPPSELLSDIFPSRSPSPDFSPDLARLRATHNTLGYRAGVSESKSQHVQRGFDEGYAIGTRIGLRLGWALGVLAALPGDEEVTRACRDAEREFAVEEVFSPRWWDGNGVWKWEVLDTEGRDTTLDDVVEQWPLWRGWLERVTRLAEGKGLRIRELKEAAELEDEEKVESLSPT